MAAATTHSLRFISVKLTPIGRAQTYRVDDEGARMPELGQAVIVQAEHGPTLGTVTPTIPQTAARRSGAAEPAHRLVRLASHEDIVTRLRHRQREEEAHRVALLKIREHGLPMKLTRVEQTFDGSKLLLYFTAEARVDFRDLLRELAAQFRMRIEMRQIGARDEAKAIGGYGTCGRPLCCTMFLTAFEPISIKMARQQDLSLNPSKLSGMCGRLKCCLRYELPNAKGQVHGGCGSDGACDNPSGCGQGSGGSGGCSSGSCRCH